MPALWKYAGQNFNCPLENDSAGRDAWRLGTENVSSWCARECADKLAIPLSSQATRRIELGFTSRPETIRCPLLHSALRRLLELLPVSGLVVGPRGSAHAVLSLDEGNTQAISAVHRAVPAFTSGEGVVNGEEERRSSEETQRLCADPPILGERSQPAQALRCLYNNSRRKIPNPHPIASHGYLQVIVRSILRNLVPLCPAPNRLETPTHMFRIEINKWMW